MNGLGMALRESGQRREPEPPQRMTGWIFMVLLMIIPPFENI
jgi:hypothetical protein